MSDDATLRLLQLLSAAVSSQACRLSALHELIVERGIVTEQAIAERMARMNNSAQTDMELSGDADAVTWRRLRQAAREAEGEEPPAAKESV